MQEQALKALEKLTANFFSLRKKVKPPELKVFSVPPIPEPPVPVLVIDQELAEELKISVLEVRKEFEPLVLEKKVRLVSSQWPGFKYELLSEQREDQPLVKKIKAWLVETEKKKFVDREVYWAFLKKDQQTLFEPISQALVGMCTSGFLKADTEFHVPNSDGNTYTVR